MYGDGEWGDGEGVVYKEGKGELIELKGEKGVDVCKMKKECDERKMDGGWFYEGMIGGD